jgi:hypothetical protein
MSAGSTPRAAAVALMSVCKSLGVNIGFPLESVGGSVIPAIPTAKFTETTASGSYTAYMDRFSSFINSGTLTTRRIEVAVIIVVWEKSPLTKSPVAAALVEPDAVIAAKYSGRGDT